MAVALVTKQASLAVDIVAGERLKIQYGPKSDLVTAIQEDVPTGKVWSIIVQVTIEEKGAS